MDVLQWLANFSVAANLVQEIRAGRIQVGSNTERGVQELTPAIIDNGATTVQVDVGRFVPLAEFLFDDPKSVLPEYELALRNVKSLTEEVGAQMVVVYFTTASVVYSPYINNPSTFIIGDVRNQRYISDWLERKSSEIGFFYIDTAPELQKAAAHSPLLYADHFTQAGNDVVATIVASALSQVGLLP